MRKIYIVLIFIFSGLSSKAQVFIGFGESYNVVKNPTFELFRKSYNNVEAAYLKTPLNKLSNQTSITYMFGVNLGEYYLSFGKNKYTTSSTAESNLGAIRRMEFASNNTELELGYYSGFGKDKNGKKRRIGLGFGTSMNINKVILKSSFTTPGGFVDFGTGNRLNGIFKNNGSDYFAVLSAGVNIYKGISIILKGYYNIYSNNLEQPALIDETQNDIIAVYNSPWRSIPTDYQQPLYNPTYDPHSVIVKSGGLLQTGINTMTFRAILLVPLDFKMFKKKSENN